MVIANILSKSTISSAITETSTTSAVTVKIEDAGNAGMAEDIVEIENAGNVEDIVKIVISVIISNSQILDMYAEILSVVGCYLIAIHTPVI